MDTPKPRPRLKGQALRLFFNENCIKHKDYNPKTTSRQTLNDDHKKIVKYMLLSKSFFYFVHHLMNSLELYWTHYGYCLKLKTPKYTLQYLRLKHEMVVKWMQFIQPSLLNLSLNSKSDIKPMMELAEKLKGFIHLSAFNNPSVIPFMSKKKDQIIELNCSMNCLRIKNFPKLDLDQLSLLHLRSNEKLKFRHIFRHKIKRLQLHFNGDGEEIERSKIKKPPFYVKKRPQIEELVLCISSLEMMQRVVPFLEKLKQCVEEMKLVEVKIDTTIEMTCLKQLIREILNSYTQIMEFKSKILALFPKLAVNYKGRIVMIGDCNKSRFDAELAHLRKLKQFHKAKFIENPHLFNTHIQLRHQEDNFLFNFLLQLEFVEDSGSSADENELQEALIMAYLDDDEAEERRLRQEWDEHFLRREERRGFY